MKRSVSYFLILNLFLSIVAFSFILNISVVSGAPTNLAPGWTESVNSQGLTIITSPDGSKFMKGFEPVASLPTNYQPSHGMAGEGYEALFGKGSTAPATAGSGTWSGLGYSVSGILQGALWGLMAYGVVQMIGDEKTRV